MNKHTPGPWIATGTRVTAGNFGVLLENSHGAPEPEWEANARLIAAAPDMLATLHPLMMAASAQVDWWKKEASRLRNIGANDSSAQSCADGWFKLFKNADAAIAKATGG
jgi:hypothetical protein